MKSLCKTIIIFSTFELIMLDCTVAQPNLVPNSSFENINGCDFSIWQMQNWMVPINTSPDQFNNCSIWPILAGVPANLYGSQLPHSGNGYMGEAFYTINSWREYIEVELDSTLINGRKYCVNFYVSLADTVNLACDNIGLYFSSVYIDSVFGPSFGYLNYIPQINYTGIITDKTHWTLISGEYIAEGGEKFITIGNFYSNANTNIDTITISPTNNFSYYYIDDVSVIDCTTVRVEEAEKGENDFILYPNPNNGSMTLEYKIDLSSSGLFSIYDLSGRLIKEKRLDNNVNKVIIDATNLSAGAYYYIINVNKRDLKVNKLIIVR